MGHLKLFSSLGPVNESHILTVLLQPPFHTILHLRQLSSWNLESFPTFPTLYRVEVPTMNTFILLWTSTLGLGMELIPAFSITAL